MKTSTKVSFAPEVQNGVSTSPPKCGPNCYYWTKSNGHVHLMKPEQCTNASHYWAIHWNPFQLVETY